MSVQVNNALDLPLEARHLESSLRTARELGDEFRSIEMAWLEENNPRTLVHFRDMYKLKIDIDGITEADYMLRGCVLGSSAVRMCSEEGLFDYSLAISNYQNNLKTQTDKRFKLGTNFYKLYEDRSSLSELFVDKNIVDVLMSIVHKTSRDSAAVTLAYFCMKEIQVI